MRIGRTRFIWRSLVSAAVACGLCVSPAAATTFTRDDVSTMVQQILQPWTELQNANGTFPDYYRANNDHGRSRGYDEPMMGHALIHWGVATGNAAMTQSGLRAMAWNVNPANRWYLESVFESYAVAAAYVEAKRAGLLSRPENRQLTDWWQRWLANRQSFLMDHHVFSNKRTVEAASYTQLLATGLRSSTRGAILSGLASARKELRDYNAALVASGRKYRHRGGVALFSDPSSNPLAYAVLTAAFGARYIADYPGKAPRSVRTAWYELMKGLLAATGPDGDIAYSGRSQAQSWALSLGAYASLQAAAWKRGARDERQFRQLAGRYLERLRSLHMPSGKLYITPVLRWFHSPAAQASASPVVSSSSTQDLLAGIDDYAGATVYESLTALGLQWSLPLIERTSPTSVSSTPLTGRRISSGISELVTLRRDDVWAAVKPMSSDNTDLRYDAGLVRLKIRQGNTWTDLLPLLPLTTEHGSDSLAPQLLVNGKTLLPRGTVRKVSSSKVVLSLRYSNGSRAVMKVRLTDTGAVVVLDGRPHQRYRFGVTRYRTVNDSPTRTGLVTATAVHRFSPVPAAITNGGRMNSGEAMLERFNVNVAAGRGGFVRWSVKLRR